MYKQLLSNSVLWNPRILKICLGKQWAGLLTWLQSEQLCFIAYVSAQYFLQE